MSTTANFYAGVETNTRERVSLAPGSYGTSKQPGLKIVAHIEKSTKLDKSGAMRYSFLVAATRPSREQLQAGTNGKAKAAGDNPLEEIDFEGTAFLSLTLHELWKAPESVALAFTEASRNKDGVVQKDMVPGAIAAGLTTQENIDRAVAHYQSIAANKVLAANTPDDQVQSATETQYRKELQQVSIKVGQFFTLQDWKNGGDKGKRDIGLDPASLVGTEFSGKVERSTFGDGTGSEVASIYSRG